MAHNSVYSMQPSTAARPYPSYSFQIQPSSSAKSNPQPTLRPAETFRQMDRVSESGGPVNYQGAISIPPMDWAINVLRLEKNKHTETLIALQSSRKSNLQLESLLCQERAFNNTLQHNAQQDAMQRVYLEGKLRAHQQNVVCNLTLRQNYTANLYLGAHNAAIGL